MIEFGKLCGPLAHSVLYLLFTNTRLALKLFRGEPAISKFDWNFSAIHRSSPPFSTDVWFGPPWNFTSTSTCPWIGHPVSGLRHATLRPIPSRGSFHLSLTVLCAIGHWIVFSLGGWSLLLPTGFLVSCGTLVSACRFCFSDTGLLPSLEVLSRTLLLSIVVHVADPQPHPTVVGWFGLFRFRSPLLTKSMFLSFPPGT